MAIIRPFAAQTIDQEVYQHSQCITNTCSDILLKGTAQPVILHLDPHMGHSYYKGEAAFKLDISAIAKNYDLTGLFNVKGNTIVKIHNQDTNAVHEFITPGHTLHKQSIILGTNSNQVIDGFITEVNGKQYYNSYCENTLCKPVSINGAAQPTIHHLSTHSGKGELSGCVQDQLINIEALVRDYGITVDHDIEIYPINKGQSNEGAMIKFYDSNHESRYELIMGECNESNITEDFILYA